MCAGLRLNVFVSLRSSRENSKLWMHGNKQEAAGSQPLVGTQTTAAWRRRKRFFFHWMYGYTFCCVQPHSIWNSLEVLKTAVDLCRTARRSQRGQLQKRRAKLGTNHSLTVDTIHGPTHYALTHSVLKDSLGGKRSQPNQRLPQHT